MSKGLSGKVLDALGAQPVSVYEYRDISQEPIEVGCFVLCRGDGREPYRVTADDKKGNFYLQALNHGVSDGGWESGKKLTRVTVTRYQEAEVLGS